MDEAFEQRDHARDHNKRLHDLCLAVIDGGVTATDLALGSSAH